MTEDEILALPDSENCPFCVDSHMERIGLLAENASRLSDRNEDAVSKETQEVDVSQYEAAIEELAADKERMSTLDSYRREHIAALQRELENLRTQLDIPSASEQESPEQSSS